MSDFLSIALPKGRLGDKAYRALAEAGFPCPEMEEENRKLIFTEYVKSHSVKESILTYVSIELTPLCNFDCEMCYIRRTEKEVIDSGNHVMSFEEWKPYFEDILMQCFHSYTLRKDISISALTSGFANPHVKADFVLGIHPCIVILLSSNQKRARPLGYHALTNAGFRTLVFYTPLSNRRDYVIQRVGKALNP